MLIRMYRHTARLLLVLVLTGTLAPLAMAAESVGPHACCMRKTMRCHREAPASAEFRAPGVECQHSCCHALTVSQAAHVSPEIAASELRGVAPLPAQRSSFPPSYPVETSHSGRAPPQFSIL